jgi:hypothetical protein
MRRIQVEQHYGVSSYVTGDSHFSLPQSQLVIVLYLIQDVSHSHVTAHFPHSYTL